MAEIRMTEWIYGRKKFGRMDIWPKKKSAEKTKGCKTSDRKTNGRQTQARADIWPKRRFTENCIQPNKHKNELSIANKQLIQFILRSQTGKSTERHLTDWRITQLIEQMKYKINVSPYRMLNRNFY